MFKKFSSKNIMSPCDGNVVELSKVPDPVFAEKMLGDGFAVIPSETAVYAPVSGKVIDVADTLHAYCITTPDGLDVLVHVGINTVGLGGKGFSPKVKSGDEVKVGDLLCTFEPEVFETKGCSTHIPVIITNSDEVKSVDVNKGNKKSGDVCLTYRK